MTVWIDSDSCPAAVRDEVMERITSLKDSGHDIRGIFVADRPLPIGESGAICFVLVPREKESADDFILSSLGTDDMVLTKDFLLAERTVAKGIPTLNFDGRVFEKDWLAKRIEERNLMEVLYNSGSVTRYRKKSRSESKNRDFAFSFSREIDKILFKGE